MKSRSFLAKAPAIALILGGSLLASTLGASGPSELGSASGMDAGAAAIPRLPTLTDNPPSADVSPRPTLDEWKTAIEISPTRAVRSKSATYADPCRTFRVREWLKVHCHNDGIASVKLIAGQADGVLTWMTGTDGRSLEDGEVILPVRRGDARYFEIVVGVSSYGDGASPDLGLTISESWLPSDPAPALVVLELPVGE